MDNVQQILTRIVIRNDSVANWESADPVLLKGEMGVATDINKIKIGDGIKTWKELSYSGISMDEVLAAVPRDTYTVLENTGNKTDDEMLASITDMKQGDTVVIKTFIATATDGDKYSYTGYVYNGTAWGAMDGNYNVKNVYFPEDMVVTQSFGKYTTSTSTPNKTVPSAGKNLYDVFMDAFSEKKNPSKTAPKVSTFNVTGNGNSSTSFEVGTTVTPQWDCAFNAGSYTYKSSVSNTSISPVSGTGVSATGWEIKQGSDVIGTTEDGVAVSSFIIGDTNNSDVSGSVNYSVTATYSDGNYALTNLNTIPEKEVRITAGTTDAVSDTLTFVRKMFGGGTAEKIVDSAVVRGEKSANASAVSSSSPFEFVAVAGDEKVIFAYPKALTTKTPKFEIFTMAWGETSGFVSSEVEVADARGTNDDGTLNNAMTYTVWTYTPAGAFVASETKYRVYF